MLKMYIVHSFIERCKKLVTLYPESQVTKKVSVQRLSGYNYDAGD